MNIIRNNMPQASGKANTNSVRGNSQGTNTTGTVVNGNALRQTARITGNMILAQMQPGSTFAGDIIDVRGNAIKILLGENKTLEAATTDSKNLNIGDHITFNVESNNGATVVIKPLKINNYNTNVLLKALEAAEVPVNDKNVEIVKAMMRNEMSIDKNALSEFIKKVEAFNTERPEDIVEMERHGIPLTQENIEQYSAYKNLEHRLVAQAETLSTDIPDSLKSVLDSDGQNEMTELAEKLINLLDDISDEQTNSVVQNSKDGMVVIKGAMDNAQINENATGLSKEETAYFEKLGLADDAVIYERQADDMAEKMSLSKEQVLSSLNQLKGDELDKFLSSPELKEFFNEKIEKNFELNVNNLGQSDEEVKENIKKLYDNLDKKTETMLGILENAGQRNSHLSQTASNIRNNMQFMQDLNQMASYIQLPVKLNQSQAHGDLYVFNRKKGMPVEKDVVTAFLHLDLDSLGATDIHVTLEKKSLKTEFLLSDEESMQIIESHLDELKERLESKGYTATLTVDVQASETEVNPFDVVLETDKPQISIKRYSFDVRA